MIYILILNPNFRNISVGALRPLTSLQSLQIGVNPLDGGQLENVLHGLSSDLNLESLDIRNIQLGGSLPTLSFSILSNTSLKTLIFKNNRVSLQNRQTIGGTIFRGGAGRKEGGGGGVRSR